jgi:hypothetical protein
MVSVLKHVKSMGCWLTRYEVQSEGTGGHFVRRTVLRKANDGLWYLDQVLVRSLGRGLVLDGYALNLVYVYDTVKWAESWRCLG